MRVRLIVPRRGDGGHRDRLWEFCRPRWEPLGWPIVEGDAPGEWSRAAAINRAAEGNWDVAVIIDSDVVVDLNNVRQAVQRAADRGAMVLPYERRWMVTAEGTRAILDDGYDGPWAKVAAWDAYAAFSSAVNVVSRKLWDAIGGFDERFVGWGGDDDAFTSSCAALAGVLRIPGIVWHLHHQFDPTRQYALDMAKLKKHAPGYRQSKLLANRYRATTTRDAMLRLLAEPRTADQVVVVCVTNGKRDTLAKTLHSADEMLTGPIGRKVVVGDNCSPAFDGWETVRVRGGSYFKAVQAAWEVALGSGQPWVFWLEDDFTFPEPVDLAAMQAAMDAEPRLVQMVLLRQAWYAPEIEHGGVIEHGQAEGSRFDQRDGWVEHARYWSMNPMLTRRSFMAERDWPQQPDSELRFHRSLIGHNAWPVYGIWGSIGDAPRAIHIGSQRAGKAAGY